MQVRKQAFRERVFPTHFILPSVTCLSFLLLSFFLFLSLSLSTSSRPTAHSTFSRELLPQYHYAINTLWANLVVTGSSARSFVDIVYTNDRLPVIHLHLHHVRSLIYWMVVALVHSDLYICPHTYTWIHI